MPDGPFGPASPTHSGNALLGTSDQIVRIKLSFILYVLHHCMLCTKLHDVNFLHRANLLNQIKTLALQQLFIQVGDNVEIWVQQGCENRKVYLEDLDKTVIH